MDTEVGECWEIKAKTNKKIGFSVLQEGRGMLADEAQKII